MNNKKKKIVLYKPGIDRKNYIYRNDLVDRKGKHTAIHDNLSSHIRLWVIIIGNCLYELWDGSFFIMDHYEFILLSNFDCDM